MTTRHPMATPSRAALLLPLLAACGGGAPEAPSPEVMAANAAATITAADMDRRIGILAADSMAGRDTPSPEIEAAAAYIADRFRAWGLQPAGEDGTFIHRYPYALTTMKAEDVVLRVKGTETRARYERDFFLIPGMRGATEGRAVYGGTVGTTQALPSEAQGGILIVDLPGSGADQAMQQALIGAIQLAMMNGAAGVVAVLSPEFPGSTIGQIASAVTGQTAPLPIIGVTDEAARQLVSAAGGDVEALRAAGAPAVLPGSIEVSATRSESEVMPPNVVAMREGSDPALRNTYVVITAHFDHVGVGAADETGDSIFNGADDNASGTAALMEVAQAFAEMPAAPARSVIFLAVSGEEKGLLGAMGYVADPTVPIDSVVANVNMDMIGRNAPDTVIGIGQEYSTLQGVLETITATHPDLGLNVILDPLPEENLFFRSDQLAFIQQGIPAVFFTTGLHDDYHEQSDNPGTVDADKASRVARLAYYLAYAIANAAERPEWTEEGKAQVEQMLQGSPF